MIATLVLLQATTYTLPIGRPGQATVAVNEVRDMRTDTPATPALIAEAAKGYRFVFVGESHDNPHHHKMQADIIQALAEAGRDVVVGFEMFTRPVQKALNPWTLGMYTKEEFIKEADWKGQWGFPFEIYEPIFEVTKKYRMPMVALNVPRDWVRAVGRGGYDGLTAEQKAQLPKDFYLGNKEHRQLIESMMGGHPMTGTQGENMYKAQTLWDEGMADTALKYLDSRTVGPDTVFVIVAGSGHGMYGQGINYRIKRRTGMDTLNVTCVESKEPIKVARGLGDFVYCSPEVERKGG
jgi:uncharacterized iron-regulated protein